MSKLAADLPEPPRTPTLARRAVAESLGTAFLLAAVVGSGITGERLMGGSAGLALLAPRPQPCFFAGRFQLSQPPPMPWFYPIQGRDHER